MKAPLIGIRSMSRVYRFVLRIAYGQAHVIDDIYVTTRRCPYPFLATFHPLLCCGYVGGAAPWRLCFPEFTLEEMGHVLSAPSGLIRIRETGNLSD